MVRNWRVERRGWGGEAVESGGTVFLSAFIRHWQSTYRQGVLYVCLLVYPQEFAESTTMASIVKVPIFAPILLLLAGVGLLILPSVTGSLMVGHGEYVCGIAYLVCGASCFVLKEHQTIGMAFGGLFITATVIVWANLELPGVSLALFPPAAFIPLWQMNKAIRKAKQV